MIHLRWLDLTNLWLQLTAERQSSAAGGEDACEGMVYRKHEWESTTKKASNRSWDKVYLTLRQGELAAYKVRHSVNTSLLGYLTKWVFNVSALSTIGSKVSQSCSRSSLSQRKSAGHSHCRRRSGRRLHQEETRFPSQVRNNCWTRVVSSLLTFILNDSFRLANGGEYLFQAKDDEEMNVWVNKLQASTTAAVESAGSSRAQTMPAQATKEEPKKRSFFTLKKK